MTVHRLCASHKYVCLEIFGIDEVSLNLFNNGSKSAGHNLQKLQERNINFTSDVSIHAVAICQGAFASFSFEQKKKTLRLLFMDGVQLPHG